MSTSKGKKWGVIGLVAGGVILTSVLIWNLLVPKTAKAGTPNKAGTPPAPNSPSLWGRNTPPPSPYKTPAPSSGTSGTNFPIRKGSQGVFVQELQWALQSLGQDLPQYGADGKFGSETEAALVAVTGKSSVDNEDELATIFRRSNEADMAKSGGYGT